MFRRALLCANSARLERSIRISGVTVPDLAEFAANAQLFYTNLMPLHKDSACINYSRCINNIILSFIFYVSFSLREYVPDFPTLLAHSLQDAPNHFSPYNAFSNILLFYFGHNHLHYESPSILFRIFRNRFTHSVCLKCSRNRKADCIHNIVRHAI